MCLQRIEGENGSKKKKNEQKVLREGVQKWRFYYYYLSRQTIAQFSEYRLSCVHVPNALANVPARTSHYGRIVCV